MLPIWLILAYLCIPLPTNSLLFKVGDIYNKNYGRIDCEHLLKHCLYWFFYQRHRDTYVIWKFLCWHRNKSEICMLGSRWSQMLNFFGNHVQCLQSLVATPPLSLNRTSLFALPFVRGPYTLTSSHPAKFLFSCESSTIFLLYFL